MYYYKLKQSGILFITDMFIIGKLFQKNNVSSWVELQDMKAVNGTYMKHQPSDINHLRFSEQDRLSSSSTVRLEAGDVIRFGIYDSCYQLVKVPLVVSTSMLPNSDEVLSDLLALGGTFSREWSESCTHLIMENIQLSAKVSIKHITEYN